MLRAISALLVLLLLAACGRDVPTDVDADERLAAGAVVTGSTETFQEILRGFRGRPVVVNFWATWCEPCKTEMPILVESARRHDGRVHFLGVNVEDRESSARTFAREYRISFPSIGDPRGDIRRAEQISGLPTTQFYRADGELAFVHAGEIDEEELERRLQELIRIGVPVRTPGG